MRRRQKITGLAWLAVTMELAGNGWAQAPATNSVWGKYPNSMLIKTRTAATYPKDLWVFTMVGLYQDLDHHSNPNLDREITTMSLWAEYGITDWFQIGICQPHLHRQTEDRSAGTRDSANGFGDTQLYAKGQLLKESAYVPAFALDGLVKLPSGDEDRGLSNGEVDVTLGMGISKRWRELSLHVNPEYVITGGSASKLGVAADDRTALNVGLMWHATPKLIPMAEYNGYWWGDAGALAEIGGGALWFPTKNTSVKIGVSTPVCKDVTWAAEWTPWLKLAVWF